ncbi:hypothetical protein [Cognataquiflexum rubidum]|uniref:hypothetical protein n=1 Tax=Cognataquiflexum rubidum TaxID=2922273 RepID=UPI001F145778|nr:hypothetical protein [Cognataquiflexum rubidum]MCH6235322.1 hypothetical protein [Cognataquiflexum rubidum]
MQTDVYLILLYIGILLSVPLFFIGDFEFKKLYRILFGVIVMVTILETFGSYLASNGKQNVIYYNLIFVYLETLLLLYFYYNVFHNKKAKKYTALATVAFFLWAIIYSTFFQSLFVFHTVSYVMGGIILIFGSLYFFYGIMKEDWYHDQSLLGMPMFWIVTMIMFFYSGSLLYFSSINFISSQNIELLGKFNIIIQALSVLMYWVMGLSFYIPIWIERKSKIIGK